MTNGTEVVMSVKYKLNSCLMSVLGSVLRKAAGFCDIVSIAHYKGCGVAISVELPNNPRQHGLIEVWANAVDEPEPVRVSVGEFELKVSSSDEIDQAELFRSEKEFLNCFRREN